MRTFEGWIPDFENRKFFYGEIQVDGTHINNIKRLRDNEQSRGERDIYILPGLVDAHVHIESSMLVPSGFAKQAVKYGTVATVSDPHEIANVLGKEGIDFMFRDADRHPLKISFTAPSCVPATEFEESGAILEARELEELTAKYEFVALGEMMNFPGVIRDDPKIRSKLELFKRLQVPIDGHAPGLQGGDLTKYINSGINTDHEATGIEEAEEKIKNGMKILIREGSAARNFDSLWPLIQKYPTTIIL